MVFVKFPPARAADKKWCNSEKNKFYAKKMGHLMGIVAVAKISERLEKMFLSYRF